MNIYIYILWQLKTYLIKNFLYEPPQSFISFTVFLFKFFLCNLEFKCVERFTWLNICLLQISHVNFVTELSYDKVY